MKGTLMTHVTALAISQSLPMAIHQVHGHNWSWTYYETQEDAQKVCDAMRSHRNDKWGSGRCDDPRPAGNPDLGWVLHYHYNNHVSTQVDYEKQKEIKERLDKAKQTV